MAFRAQSPVPAAEARPAGTCLAQSEREGPALLIVGASVRAAAFSALRAGFAPLAFDRYADRDLAAVCRASCLPAAAYPHGLIAAAASASAAPAAPLIYTGALENHPDVIDRLAQTRTLWGNDGPKLRAVRDPLRVAEALQRAGLPCPGARLDPTGLPRDGSWLIKPLASGGGQGIEPLLQESAPGTQGRYYQQRIAGPALSAVYLASRGPAASAAALVGVTWQWLGTPGMPFAYRGSVGPYPLADSLRARVERLGLALASASGLIGLFGIDFVVNGDQPWPVEVNPRYTASVEVLEHALGRALLAEHAAAFDPRRAGLAIGLPARSLGGCVGKAVVYAKQEFTFSDEMLEGSAASLPGALPDVADIPPAGTRFATGEPVLTVFAQASGFEACRAALSAKLKHCEGRLRGDAV